MREYTITHTETIIKTYYVHAEDDDKAEEMVRDGIKREEVYLATEMSRDSYDCDDGEEI